jgi:hypothetical protein
MALDFVLPAMLSAKSSKGPRRDHSSALFRHQESQHSGLF